MQFASQNHDANGLASLALTITVLRRLFPEVFNGAQLGTILAESKALIVGTGLLKDEARSLIDEAAKELGNPR